MDAIAIELRARCVGCGQAVPVNSCVDHVGCTACNRIIALDWQALLGRALATKSESGAYAVHAGDATVNVSRRPASASCPSCLGALPDEVKAFAGRGWTMCPSCGKKLALRTPPPLLAWANAELLAAEEMAPPAVAPPQPVMMGCLGCRAPMTIDGAARVATCAGCGVANYLPDELWARLHPPPSAIRWFIVGGSAPHHEHHPAPHPHASAAASPAVAPQFAPPVAPQFAPPPVAPQFAPPIAPQFAPPIAPQFDPQQVANAAALQAMLGGGGAGGPKIVINPGVQIVVATEADREARKGTPPQFANMIVHGRKERDYWSEDYDGPDKWNSLENAVMGPDGLFYCGGENDWGDAVWCMGHDLVPRWVHQLSLNDVNVALDIKHQRVVCWSTSKHSAIILSMIDGSMVGTIGGQEVDDAKVHGFDLGHCKELVGDHDGTLLALMGERLLRYDGHGTGIATWPPHSTGMFGGAKAEKLESLHYLGQDGKRHTRDVDGVYVEQIANYPLAIDDYTNLHIGYDGRYYMERARWIACFDRTGKRLYKVQLPLESVSDTLGSDGRGNLYIRGDRGSDPMSRQIVRVSADGSRADMIAKDRTSGGTVGDEDKMCVGQDGTIYLFDYGCKARILGPDGGLRWQSPKSIQEDLDEDKKIADRA
jgi:hypothetical protein